MASFIRSIPLPLILLFLHSFALITAACSPIYGALRERIISSTSALIAWCSLAMTLVSAWVVNTTGIIEYDYGTWFEVGTHHFPLRLVMDDTSSILLVLASTLFMIIIRFSATYMHKEQGFTRFFFLIHLSSTATILVCSGGTFDVLFFGWELLGLSSFLLIAFFQEREAPIRNAFRALVTYRTCDVGLLIAIVLIHYHAHTVVISDAVRTLLPLDHTNVALIVFGFVLAASGKSAQLPFSTWLPRAMEGPTPSTAYFYGGISLHAGVILLLRTAPLIQSHWGIQLLVISVGLATAVFATFVGRITTDAKNSIAYASMAQVGLMFAEIGFGFTNLALWHLVGHSLLRVFQFLRAPSTLHDLHSEHAVEHAIAARPSAFAIRMYHLCLEQFHLDSFIETYVLSNVLRAARWLDQADIKFTGSPMPSVPAVQANWQREDRAT